jgi:hypothetical protein
LREPLQIFGRELGEEREGVVDLVLRDAPDRKTHVDEDVVTDHDRLVDDVERHFAPHAPEVGDRATRADLYDAAGNA